MHNTFPPKLAVGLTPSDQHTCGCSEFFCCLRCLECNVIFDGIVERLHCQWFTSYLRLVLRLTISLSLLGLCLTCVIFTKRKPPRNLFQDIQYAHSACFCRRLHLPHICSLSAIQIQTPSQVLLHPHVMTPLLHRIHRIRSMAFRGARLDPDGQLQNFG